MGDLPALGVGTIIDIIRWLVLPCRLHFDWFQLFGAWPALSKNSVQLANPRHGDLNEASRHVASNPTSHIIAHSVQFEGRKRHLLIRRYRLLDGRETHVRTGHRSSFDLEVKSDTSAAGAREKRGGGRGAPRLWCTVYIFWQHAQVRLSPHHLISLARSLDTVQAFSLLIFSFLHRSALSYACAEWTSCARNQFPHFHFYAKRSENFIVSVYREDNCFRIEKFYRFSFLIKKSKLLQSLRSSTHIVPPILMLGHCISRIF